MPSLAPVEMFRESSSYELPAVMISAVLIMEVWIRFPATCTNNPPMIALSGTLAQPTSSRLKAA
jgi:hypothetical protein